MVKTKSFKWAEGQDISPAHKLYVRSYKTDEGYFYDNKTPDRFLWSLTKRAPIISIKIICELLLEHLVTTTPEQKAALHLVTDLNASLFPSTFDEVEKSLQFEDDKDMQMFFTNEVIKSFLGYRCGMYDECQGIYTCISALTKLMELYGKSKAYRIIGDSIRDKITFDDWIMTFDINR
jgi:hypothetical protein